MADQQHPTALVFDDADEYRPEPPPAPEIPAWKDGSVRVGIHTSIAGEITSALDIAHGLGANALQIFSASPRMWTNNTWRILDMDAARFRERRKELALGPLVVHGNYLINLASPSPILRTRSVQSFRQEIVRAIALGADYLVIHPGSASERGPEPAIAAIAQGIRQGARDLKLGDLQILLENTAGQGASVGSRFEELRGILDICRDLPMGICMDTAHIFAAGWDIRSAGGLEQALDHVDRIVGLHRIAVVHVNDSKTPLGSRVDRHEKIGKGKIGLEAFGRILNHPRLARCAFILETPIDKPGDDRRNVAAIWKLLGRDAIAVRGIGMKPRNRPAAGRAKKSPSRKAKSKAKSWGK